MNHNKEERLRREIFGSRVKPVALSEMARVTGIPRTTLTRWRESPHLITAEGLSKILLASGTDVENMGRILTIYSK